MRINRLIKSLQSDLFSLLVISLFLGLYVSIAVSTNYRDVYRSSQWRMQHGWDEGQNVARTLSIVRKGYKDNTLIPREQSQAYLLISSLTSKLVSDSYELHSQIAIALRNGATLFLVLSFIFFYYLLRMQFSVGPSLLTWIVFASYSWDYISIGNTAKEDAFCFWIVISTFICLLSLLKKPKDWKIYLSAVLIGIGGGTKQYPLLLSLFYPLYFYRLKLPILKNFMRTMILAVLIVFVMILLNPNHYLSAFKLSHSVTEMITAQQSQSSFMLQIQSIWQIIKPLFILRYRELFLSSLLLILYIYKLKSPSETFHLPPALQFIQKYRFDLTLFFLSYFGISLFKQSYYVSIRYFLINEVIFFFLLASVFEALLSISSKKIKTVFFTVIFGLFAIVTLKRANFNFSHQIAMAETAIKESKHSSFDELEKFLSSLNEDQRKNMLSHWYVYINEKFNPTYLHLIDQGYLAAKVFLEDEYHYKHLNETLSRGLLAKVRPTLFLTLTKLEEKDLVLFPCVKPLYSIQSEAPNSYSNIFEAVFHFHSTRLNLNSETHSGFQAAGPPIHIYDTRDCH